MHQQRERSVARYGAFTVSGRWGAQQDRSDEPAHGILASARVSAYSVSLPCPTKSTWQRYDSGLVGHDEADAYDEGAKQSYATPAASVGPTLPGVLSQHGACPEQQRCGNDWMSAFQIRMIALEKQAKCPNGIALFRHGLESYWLSPPIAKGAYGKVYFSFSPAGGGLMGVKKVRLQATPGKHSAMRCTGIKRIIQEIALQNKYGQPNAIVQMATYKHKCMVWMPAYDGSLAKWMQLPRWQIAPFALRRLMARAVLVCVGQQLARMHQEDVIHGDIKPDNLLLDRHLGISLCDFGLATRLADGGNRSGTWPFFAPELFADQHATCSKASDTWSFGLTILVILAGEINMWPMVEHLPRVTSPQTAWQYCQGANQQLLAAMQQMDWEGLPPVYPPNELGGTLLGSAFAADSDLTMYLVRAVLRPSPTDRVAMATFVQWAVQSPQMLLDIRPMLHHIYEIETGPFGSRPAWLLAKSQFLTQMSHYMLEEVIGG